MFNGKTILITGGTGSFGKYFTEFVLSKYKPKKIIIFSRDEYKQFLMSNKLNKYSDVMRYFVGDVRDKERLMRAFKNVDYVIHAAALKQVPSCEYNPIEAIKTNINGAMNVIDAALDNHVEKVVALSTDKAVNPVNLYGGTKLVSDKLFVSANAYSGAYGTLFSIVRYGNVAGSRGSVIPFFTKLIESGADELPVTDAEMTRFWINLEQGAELVMKAFELSKGGEIFISKIPSFRITDIVKAMLPGGKYKEIGIREGEKLHEIMITKEDAMTTYEFEDFYVIYPQMNWHKKITQMSGGKLVPQGFEYSSGANEDMLSIEQLKEKIDNLVFEV